MLFRYIKMIKQKSVLIRITIVILILAAAVFCLYHFGRNKGLRGGSETSLSETGPAAVRTSADAPKSTPSPVKTPLPAASPVPEPTPEETPEPVDETASEMTDGSALETAPEEIAEPSFEAVPEETEEPSEEAVPEESEDPSPAQNGFLNDIESIPAGTPVEEERIDRSNIDGYFNNYEISDALFDRIYGDDRSYKTYCTVPRSDLRYVKVLYRGFDGATYVGELMVNYLVADEITEIFRELYLNDYPIELMLLVDDFGADDDLSIANNNTSAFNYRSITGGTTPSNHAYGCAIDINPKNNPYIEYDANGDPIWYDADVEYYLDRDAPDAYERHMITHDDLCFRLFSEYGWSWGGDWTNPVDYQHFEKPVYP